MLAIPQLGTIISKTAGMHICIRVDTQMFGSMIMLLALVSSGILGISSVILLAKYVTGFNHFSGCSEPLMKTNGMSWVA
jgi:hypothetical protein